MLLCLPPLPAHPHFKSLHTRERKSNIPSALPQYFLLFSHTSLHLCKLAPSPAVSWPSASPHTPPPPSPMHFSHALALALFASPALHVPGNETSQDCAEGYAAGSVSVHASDSGIWRGCVHTQAAITTRSSSSSYKVTVWVTVHSVALTSHYCAPPPLPSPLRLIPPCNNTHSSPAPWASGMISSWWSWSTSLSLSPRRILWRLPITVLVFCFFFFLLSISASLSPPAACNPIPLCLLLLFVPLQKIQIQKTLKINKLSTLIHTQVLARQTSQVDFDGAGSQQNRTSCTTSD